MSDDKPRSEPYVCPVDERNRKIRRVKKGVGSTSGFPDLPCSDEKRWQTVYPIYLNKDKTLASVDERGPLLK